MRKDSQVEEWSNVLKRSIVVPIVIVVAAVALFVALVTQWTPFQGSTTSPETNDASVRADQTPLSTRVSGTVRKVWVVDFQPVTRGELLVELDDSDYKAVLQETEAALATAQAEYAANQDAKRAADAAVASARQAIGGAQSAADAAHAGIVGVQAEMTHAQEEFDRQSRLLAGKAATQQELDVAVAARDRAAAELQAHQAQFSGSNTVVGTARSTLVATQQQRAGLGARDAGLLAQIDARRAAITIAQVNLQYTKIYAPANGRLGEVRVHAGQLVGPGIPVVDLVQSEMYVQANYRETQLEYVQPGDGAEITVDAVRGHVFHGRVSQIAPASGSEFALLPPDNATGNFTKIVQRVPVRIELSADAENARLRPGFSVEVKIPSTAGKAR